MTKLRRTKRWTALHRLLGSSLFLLRNTTISRMSLTCLCPLLLKISCRAIATVLIRLVAYRMPCSSRQALSTLHHRDLCSSTPCPSWPTRRTNCRPARSWQKCSQFWPRSLARSSPLAPTTVKVAHPARIAPAARSRKGQTWSRSMTRD